MESVANVIVTQKSSNNFDYQNKLLRMNGANFIFRVVQLVSGSHKYIHAIVVSINPFVLVSQHGDMLWRKHKPENFTIVNRSVNPYISPAIQRWERENNV